MDKKLLDVAINSLWFLSHVLGAMGMALTALLITAITHRLFFDPFSRIPGPRLAAVSNIWFAYHTRNGATAAMAKKLHRRYGPVVRVGPTEVWFDTKEAFDQIYNRRLNAEFQDNLDLLSERDMHRYRLQRRLIGRVYRTANAVRHEQALDRVMDDVIKKFNSINGADIDLKEWMHIIAVESLGAVVLSWSPGMIKAGTDRDTSNQSYLGWRRKSVFGLFPLITKLEVNHRWIGRMFGTLWGITYQTPKGFKPFFPDVAKKVARRIKNASNSRTSQKEDLLADLISLHQEKPKFTELYLRKMAITNFGAGHETLASTLTAVMAMLGTHPDVQATARQEIRLHKAEKSQKAEESQKSETIISYTDALELVYTRAVIREAMRLYPVISMGLPRVVPLRDGGLQLHGFHIPPGAIVGCNPVSLHRNPDICGPNPDAFDPRRWLAAGSSDDEARVRALERYSLNWGGGSRTCPGRHVAEMIVLKCVVRLLERFEVRGAGPALEDEGPTYFLAMLTGVRARFLGV
ncbi:Cytochrome P450 [Cordyceps militaris]|uniref:Cytochrome P450 n=1 Tax=Cordyceps militaris TaxID=73501 RepID=A0A2H4SCA1_CORMI|nr:Cytochrome P450 [Cordyceps militaris]